MLSQENKIPLYLQLKESIRSEIVNKKLKSGEKIPTEVELSEKYEISRVTVRKAITELVEEGYLIKKQGKGTFVSKPKIERKIVHLISFSAACEANGLKASSEVIKREIIQPEPEVIQLLQLDPDDLVVYIQRVRYAGENPLMLENNYFPYNKYKFLLNENLDGSLYQTLKEHHIHPSNPGETTLEIVRALEEEAQLLEVPSGEPLFLMKTVIFDQNHQPIHIGKQLIVGEGYKFTFS